MVIVETADAVLVAHKDHCQKVKQVVDDLKVGKRDEALLHRRVNRPWGAYECIDSGDRFQVKRITVNPGAGLSLQKHMHRAEHWVVVRGTAHITRGKKVVTLSENESTYIPLGIRHRLETREDPARTDRGAVRQLPRRGRHRQVRRPVRQKRQQEAKV